MIRGFLVLLLCQLAGEFIARTLDVPVPGGVIGMLLLFVGLLINRGIPEDIESTSRGLLQNLSLYFVPASVGIMTMGPLLAKEGVRIGVVMTLATIIPLLACGYLLDRWLAHRGVS